MQFGGNLALLSYAQKHPIEAFFGHRSVLSRAASLPCASFEISKAGESNSRSSERKTGFRKKRGRRSDERLFGSASQAPKFWLRAVWAGQTRRNLGE